MRVSLVFATLLCFTMWKSSDHKIHLPLTSCCVVWSKTKVVLTGIANYTIQSEGVCPIAAIRFVTTQGKTICSDPDTGWAKRAKAKVDEESRKNILQNNRQNDEGATSDMTPATATTSTYTTQRENGQYDEGATSDITPTTATTSKLHLTEKPEVQWENGPKTFCLRNHNTSHSYHRQQTLLFTIALLLLYCINSKHMWN